MFKISCGSNSNSRQRETETPDPFRNKIWQNSTKYPWSMNFFYLREILGINMGFYVFLSYVQVTFFNHNSNSKSPWLSFIHNFTVLIPHYFRCQNIRIKEIMLYSHNENTIFYYFFDFGFSNLFRNLTKFGTLHRLT